MIARLLVQALEKAGFSIEVASRLRSRVANGDAMKQARMAELGHKLALRLMKSYASGKRRTPDIWFTYHLYYKAPDFIGPLVSKALNIPYVVAEASFAPKRENGLWRQSHEAVTYALQQADLVLSLNKTDMECLAQVTRPEVNCYLPPFLDPVLWENKNTPPDVKADCPDWPAKEHRTHFVTIAMMRAGDKLRSYLLLADALGKLRAKGVTNWDLTIIGDGEAREQVMAAFAQNAVPRDAVTFQGLCHQETSAKLLAKSDVFIWPAINEAYGMAMLEAQAAGLPVLAGNTGGVSGIVEHGQTGWLVPVGDSDAFACGVEKCCAMSDRDLKAIGQAAVCKVNEYHSIEAASGILQRTINNLLMSTEGHGK